MSDTRRVDEIRARLRAGSFNQSVADALALLAALDEAVARADRLAERSANAVRAMQAMARIASDRQNEAAQLRERIDKLVLDMSLIGADKHDLATWRDRVAGLLPPVTPPEPQHGGIPDDWGIRGERCPDCHRPLPHTNAESRVCPFPVTPVDEPDERCEHGHSGPHNPVVASRGGLDFRVACPGGLPVTPVVEPECEHSGVSVQRCKDLDLCDCFDHEDRDGEKS